MATRRNGSILVLLTVVLAALGGTAARGADTWVFIGDSLTVGMIGDGAAFTELVRKHLNVDVKVVNTSRVGKHVTEYVSEIDGILAAHPQAKFFPITIGTNDVLNYSQSQGDWLRSKLTTVLDKIVAAGRTPILCRIPFRRHSSGDPLGAFAEKVYDPLIKKYSPRWYDDGAGKGRVDLHGFLKGHPEYLAGDGVHMTPAGYAAARKEMLVQVMAAIAYGKGAGSAAEPSDTQVGLLGVSVSGASSTAAVEPDASAADALGRCRRRVAHFLQQAANAPSSAVRAFYVCCIRESIDRALDDGVEAKKLAPEITSLQDSIRALGFDPGRQDGTYDAGTRDGATAVLIALGQLCLRSAGYDAGPVNGEDSRQTSRAVQAYRKAQGLDNLSDDVTLSLIYRLLGGKKE